MWGMYEEDDLLEIMPIFLGVEYADVNERFDI